MTLGFWTTKIDSAAQPRYRNEDGSQDLSGVAVEFDSGHHGYYLFNADCAGFLSQHNYASRDRLSTTKALSNPWVSDSQVIQSRWLKWGDLFHPSTIRSFRRKHPHYCTWQLRLFNSPVCLMYHNVGPTGNAQFSVLERPSMGHGSNGGRRFSQGRRCSRVSER